MEQVLARRFSKEAILFKKKKQKKNETEAESR